MGKAPQRFVLENMLVAGHPMVPGDSSFQHELLEDADPELGNASVEYPAIKARLVLPLESGKSLVRPDKLYDVHYHLLALAALSDYEDHSVYYTAGGLIREMGWSEGGRQMQLVRDCVDYLFQTRMEFEGEMPDVLLPGVSSEQVRTFRILIGRGFPKKEERRSGGRNMSFVEYHPSYMKSIAQDPGVQLDVELLSQIPGTLGKAFYRTVSWLRTMGEDRIELGELFERVGSTRQRTLPSDATRVFRDAWKMMQRYRYFRSEPEIEKRGVGQYQIVFDWGDPVILPHRADQLFRAITDAGVHAGTAETMIRDNRRKITRIMLAYKGGALGKPYTTAAAQIVGMYNKDDWDFDDHRPDDEQMDLLGRHGSSRTSPISGIAPPSDTEAAPVDWDRLIDWEETSRRPGTWVSLEQDVLVPILGAAGERDPAHVLQIPKVRTRIQSAFERMGWRETIDAIYSAVPYLRTAERPASYIATVLENEVGAGEKEAAPTRAEAPAAMPVERPTTPREPSELRSREGGFTMIGVDISQFQRQQLRSWVDDLERLPLRDTARRAIQFVETRLAAQPTDADVLNLLQQIRSKAEAILGETT